jgi:SAM-dependent methyltransferase
MKHFARGGRAAPHAAAASAASDPERYRALWRRKRSLRIVYDDMYRRIDAQRRPGPTLEIGGGSGNFKERAPETVSTDILFAPWLDAVCDAQRLPFAADSFMNIVCFDALHHIERPVLFLAEAARVIAPGGRLILCEPAITPVSRFVYGLFHPEPVDMRADPTADGPATPGRNPYDANQATPTLLTGRYRAALAARVPALRLAVVERFALAAYVLSGGFRSWSLLPPFLAPALLRMERAMRPLFAPLAAFRLLAVYEKPAAVPAPHRI